jgi:hypothetical protein
MTTMKPPTQLSPQDDGDSEPQLSMPETSRSREDAWMKVVETVVIFLATWLNPNAGVAIFLLRLCFQSLEVLRRHHRKLDEKEQTKLAETTQKFGHFSKEYLETVAGVRKGLTELAEGKAVPDVPALEELRSRLHQK